MTIPPSLSPALTTAVDGPFDCRSWMGRRCACLRIDDIYIIACLIDSTTAPRMAITVTRFHAFRIITVTKLAVATSPRRSGRRVFGQSTPGKVSGFVNYAAPVIGSVLCPRDVGEM